MVPSMLFHSKSPVHHSLFCASTRAVLKRGPPCGRNLKNARSCKGAYILWSHVLRPACQNWGPRAPHTLKRSGGLACAHLQGARRYIIHEQSAMLCAACACTLNVMAAKRRSVGSQKTCAGVVNVSTFIPNASSQCNEALQPSKYWRQHLTDWRLQCVLPCRQTEA
jgi:hypothetical protein